MKGLTIRWMGAYRGCSNSLVDSLTWEMAATRQVAAATTGPDGGTLARTTHIMVGLLVRPEAVLRYYAGDSWTESRGPDGRKLRPYRDNGWSPEFRGTVAEASAQYGYSEATVSHRTVGIERYCGLVIRTVRCLRSARVQECISWARTVGLAVYVLDQSPEHRGLIPYAPKA